MSGPLVAFDPAVPDRDRLLDADAMQRRLALLHGRPRSRWGVAKVKYHPGRDLRVVYGDRGSATPVRLVVARTVPHSHETRFHAFPRDRRLVALPAVMSPTVAVRSPFGRRWTTSRLAGYAPEKSAVVACLNGDPDQPLAYAKLFANARDARAAFAIGAAVADGLSDRATVCRVPRPLMFAGEQNLLFIEAACGRRLTDLVGQELTVGVARLGAALAELHDSAMTLPAPNAGRTSDAQLDRAAQIIGTARPELVHVAAALSHVLIATRPPSPGVVPLHGDVHVKNALLDGERLWLIDFDQAHAGPAAADLGSFLAVLRADALIGACSHSRAAELATAFLRGYAAVRPLPPAPDLRWHTSAALLAERALRGITRLRRGILLHLSALLEDADRNLRRGPA